jgi:hypothetical protein
MRNATRLAAAVFFSAGLIFAQYKAEPAGAPPSELAPAIRSTMQQQGLRVSGSGITVEIWFRSTEPSGPKSAEPDVTLPTIPQGALVGALRVTGNYTDRRGQTIKPGVYTLRYSDYPVNGDHQGVAPQRDFLLLVPAGTDSDPNSTPNFDALVAMSRKASGTPHPAVLSCWKSDEGTKPGLSQSGDTDWVVNGMLGKEMISVIVVGTVSS